MPAVSWLLNVRNGMPYMRETLASIAAQTFTDYEVLVWVMQSDDGTEEELDRWIPARLPGRIFKSGLMPLGEARAELVKQSQSEFCACIDADDLNEPGRLAAQVAFLREHPEIALVGSRLRTIDEQNRLTGKTHEYPLLHEDIVNGFLSVNTIGQPAVLFRRAAVLAAGNYFSSPSIVGIEDYDLWLRLAAGHRLANLPEYLLNYRIHAPSLTRSLIAGGLHQERFLNVFRRGAPALFGVTPGEAERLCLRRDPLTVVRSVKIARHLARTQGGSFWHWLRSSSFIESFRWLTQPRDLASRLVFALIDRKSGSLGREMRLFLVQCMMKFLFSARWLESFRAWRVRRRCRAWVGAQQMRGCHLSSRINFLGSPDGCRQIKTEAGACVEPEVTIWISEDRGAQAELTLGKNVFVGRHTYLGIYQPVTIGDNTLIGAYCYLISANHCYQSRALPIREQGYVGAPIHIGEDVWIGTHVVILPGVTIGRGAIIAAGSLVNRNVPEFEIWGGMPAHFIKSRPA